jgi:hypothetical protein
MIDKKYTFGSSTLGHISKTRAQYWQPHPPVFIILDRVNTRRQVSALERYKANTKALKITAYLI